MFGDDHMRDSKFQIPDSKFQRVILVKGVCSILESAESGILDLES